MPGVAKERERLKREVQLNSTSDELDGGIQIQCRTLICPRFLGPLLRPLQASTSIFRLITTCHGRKRSRRRNWLVRFGLRLIAGCNSLPRAQTSQIWLGKAF